MGVLSAVWARSVSRLLGDGIGAEVFDRATAYLVDEAHKAIEREEIPVSTVRLRPGERYTVIARPAPTRSERRLSKRKESLQDADRRLGRSTRRQRRVARELRSVQRRVDHRRPGTRRHARALAREAVVGVRFDKAMTPTKKHRAVRRELEQVSGELDGLRDRRFAEIRSRRGIAGRPESVTVHEASVD